MTALPPRPSLSLGDRHIPQATSLARDSDEQHTPRRGLGIEHDAEHGEMYEMNEVEALDGEEADRLLKEMDEDEDKGGDGEYLMRKSGEKVREGGGYEDEGGSSMDAMVVRTVPTTDDPSLPSLTLRVIILGSIFCIIGASASQIFIFKSNAPSFSSYFVLLATYPLGHAMARWMPRGKLFGLVEMNPGPFSVKEHLLIGVLSSSGGRSAYASDILSILELYYHTSLPAIPSLTLLITTQSIGFGLAGMLQDILIKPVAMYWPSTLVMIQLFTTLHGGNGKDGVKERLLTRNRMKLFSVVAVVVFVYQFLPALFFPTLTSVATLCYINNKSWVLRTLGSGYSGLGMFDFSFDWSSVGATGPLYTPWWALVNYFGGIMGMCWVVMPIMLATNFWDSTLFPSPVSAGLYSSNFTKFDVKTVLNKDLSLNEEAWIDSKPLLLTPYFAVSYSLSFAALSSILVHVWIWHRKEIVDALARRTVHSDIHNKLMEAYKPIPSWWYGLMLLVNFIAAVVMIKTNESLQFPIWALMLAIAIATIFLVPVGIIVAVSNTEIGLNVLTEFVAGVLMPGKPIGNVTFKCYGYMALSQAISLLQDQKLAHYMHVDPGHMFITQSLGTIIGCFVNYVTLTQVISAKRPFLDGSVVDPTGQWTGRGPGIFYSASVIWGLVAPARFFSGKYMLLYLGFPLGAIVPILCYYGHKRWPKWKLNKVMFPIICSGATTVPQYPTNIITSGFIVAVTANVWLTKRYPEFHKNYIYVLSSALDASTSLNALAIYFIFSVVLPGWNIVPDWWGASTVDSEHCVPGS